MPRIMLVEDEQAIAQTLLYALETEGFTTSWVKFGKEALATLKLEPVSLLILDIGLPDINGFDVCREIRQDSELPILFLTARQSEIDRVLGLELGGDDYVTKPFSPREVVARVRRILKRSEPKAKAEATTKSALEISLTYGRATYHGVQLHLTRYELLLLHTLHSQPGRIYSRSVLMDAVWTDALDSDERTVDTHIKTLRAKLRAVKADVDPIQTYRGLGYSLQLES